MGRRLILQMMGRLESLDALDYCLAWPLSNVANFLFLQNNP